MPSMTGGGPGALRTPASLRVATSSWGTWAVVAAALWRAAHLPPEIPLRRTQRCALTYNLSRGALEAARLAVAGMACWRGRQVTVTMHLFLGLRWGPRATGDSTVGNGRSVLCCPLAECPQMCDMHMTHF